MHNQNKMDDVLAQMGDPHKFMEFRAEITEFLGNLISFINRIVPLMLELNYSLEDTFHKLPAAADRIADVNRATEYATGEILNSLDQLSASLSNLQTMEAAARQTCIESMYHELGKIMQALQFQDITSQKLTHASKILTAIYDKFNELFSSMEAANISSLLGQDFSRVEVDQSELDTRRRKRVAFEEQTKDEIHHNKMAQDEIDSHFLED